MSALPSEEMDAVEEVVTPTYIGLPLALKALSEKALQEILISYLRKEPTDVDPDPG